MYHEITYRELSRRRRKRVLCLLLVLALAAALALAALVSQAVTRDQGAATVRDGIVAAALQCCAVEGSYPSSLAHLEQRYGLVINHDAYVVNYEWLGDNVPPSVVVRLR